MFPMILKSSIGLEKWRGDIPSGSTRGCLYLEHTRETFDRFVCFELGLLSFTCVFMCMTLLVSIMLGVDFVHSAWKNS
jgi:hypothetical protein